ncbi:4-phosphoerythronate dehydrogenase [Candidatus Enterovibrio escicola]|uniref:4-phosphoerythronate dehydrogenase n=1 Tax=Candidatus Enterovibrio escicola TaxID=1927127 RepID=UPI0012382F88|nr:4-phosphoerythronate dehydrogenase [Candidatus Enterovibrio escacola]
MNILIDENMPYAAELFSKFGTVTRKSGRTLMTEDLVDVDALMIRSVTKVDEALLKKAPRLRFVGTATSGTDHLNTNLLAERGIHWTAAPGCNKASVAEYVISSLLVLSQQQDFNLTDRKVGIVGAGQVGSYLSTCLVALNIPYLLCDPIKRREGDMREFHSLQTLLSECDVITLHIPITTSGAFPTYHLISQKELTALKADAILINTARGSVVDNYALKVALLEKTLMVVLDVFESEPEIDLELLPLLAFATPHIAGHSLEGKARGITMIYNAYCDFLGHAEEHINTISLLPLAPISKVILSKEWNMADLMVLCQLVYDIRRDDSKFRRAMTDVRVQCIGFDHLRKNYWERREYSAITVAGNVSFGVELLAKLGFTVRI